jgi:hypothetical protein
MQADTTNGNTFSKELCMVTLFVLYIVTLYSKYSRDRLGQ